LLIHPRDLSPADMRLTASKPPRLVAPGPGLVLEMALALAPVLELALVLALVLVLVPELVLVLELVLEQHNRPPTGRPT